MVYNTIINLLKKQNLILVISFLLILSVSCRESSLLSPTPSPIEYKSSSNAGVSDKNFPINIYRGAGVITEKETSLQHILDQGKPVILNFWAGLCPACRAEIPNLEQVWKKHKDNLTVIAIDIGPFTKLGSFNQGQNVLRELNVTYPSGNTYDSSVLVRWGIDSIPSTHFILPDGRVVSEWKGFMGNGKLESAISKLLDKP